jgi:hypothetical protein
VPEHQRDRVLKDSRDFLLGKYGSLELISVIDYRFEENQQKNDVELPLLLAGAEAVRKHRQFTKFTLDFIQWATGSTGQTLLKWARLMFNDNTLEGVRIENYKANGLSVIRVRASAPNYKKAELPQVEKNSPKGSLPEEEDTHRLYPRPTLQ